jgi:hypothetical protein
LEPATKVLPFVRSAGLKVWSDLDFFLRRVHYWYHTEPRLKKIMNKARQNEQHHDDDIRYDDDF